MNKKHFTFRSVVGPNRGTFYPVLKGPQFWFYVDADITALTHELTPSGRIVLGQKPEKTCQLVGSQPFVLDIARHNARQIKGILANAKHNREVAAEAN